LEKPDSGIKHSRRQHFHFAKMFKDLVKHRFAVDAVVESGLPDLDRARDIVEVLPEDEVSEAPRDHLLVRNRPGEVFSRTSSRLRKRRTFAVVFSAAVFLST
jgi:hypothetical protein